MLNRNPYRRATKAFDLFERTHQALTAAADGFQQEAKSHAETAEYHRERATETFAQASKHRTFAERLGELLGKE